MPAAARFDVLRFPSSAARRAQLTRLERTKLPPTMTKGVSRGPSALPMLVTRVRTTAATDSGTPQITDAIRMKRDRSSCSATTCRDRCSKSISAREATSFPSPAPQDRQGLKVEKHNLSYSEYGRLGPHLVLCASLQGASQPGRTRWRALFAAGPEPDWPSRRLIPRSCRRDRRHAGRARCLLRR